MEDLKWIKKHYSETLAKTCRELFPTLLETKGLLPQILEQNFAFSSSLGDDVSVANNKDHFKSFIYSKVDVEKGNEVITNKTVEELFDEAGYVLFPECQTEEEIQQYKKYYAKGEELCTFRGGRLDFCRVWFAMKKEVLENANAISRKENPTRQDEYGTSVISVQFSRNTPTTLSIKNRYNHSVNNPDATFGNNLDNIIPGLTEAFENQYGLSSQNSCQNFELRNYVMANDGKLYKYNLEDNNIYFCENNIVIEHGQPKVLGKQFTLVEQYLFDSKNKTITLYDRKEDAFTKSFGKVKDIQVSKIPNSSNKRIIVKVENNQDIELEINKSSQITKYSNENFIKIEHEFLSRNKSLKEIHLPNVETIGKDFLLFNEQLTELNLPNVITINDGFLTYNDQLKEINLPQVKTIGSAFLAGNSQLKEINLPKVKTIGDDFLFENQQLEELNFPNVETIGRAFLRNNWQLKKLSLPNVKNIDGSFLYNNIQLEELNLPRVETIGLDFLGQNQQLTELTLPNVKTIGNGFLHKNTSIKTIGDKNIELWIEEHLKAQEKETNISTTKTPSTLNKDETLER